MRDQEYEAKARRDQIDAEISHARTAGQTKWLVEDGAGNRMLTDSINAQEIARHGGRILTGPMAEAE